MMFKKTLQLLILGAVLATSSIAFANKNVCDASGKQRTMQDGRTSTCGVCRQSGGATTRIWMVGDMTAAEATAKCEEIHNKGMKATSMDTEKKRKASTLR